MSSIEWRPWDDDAFALAKSSDRPVLLFLTASWCRWSRDMREKSFGDPEVAAMVGESFVAVAVDKDKRPDIDERYNMGGWPSLAFLTPEAEVITGGTYFDAGDLKAVLNRVATYYREKKDDIKGTLEELIREEAQRDEEREARSGKLQESIVSNVLEAILESYDPENGGFGVGQKFPHPEAIDFALLEFERSGNSKIGNLAERTLEAMMEGGLHDRHGGGFFRFCGTPDWREPNTEKLLEINAGLLRNYLEASQVFERADFRKTAERIVDFIFDTLYDESTGGLFGSQDGDDGYYALSASERSKREAPQVDRTVYVNTAAMGISSLFKAGAVLERPDITEKAELALNFLLDRCYWSGRGMYHYFADDNRHILGLLTDQIYTARALIHAIQYTGETRHIPVIEDLVSTIDKKQSATHGGFYDIPEDHASFPALRRRNKSILENAVIAEVLIRLSYLTHEPKYRELAEKTLEAFVEDFQSFGYFTASYGRAVDLFYHEPLQIVVVGKQEDPVRQAMVVKASAAYIPSKIVVVLDPERDQERLEALQFGPKPHAVAYVLLSRKSLAEVRDPDALTQMIEKVESERR